MNRSYHIRCEDCGAEWSGAVAGDADPAKGEADVFAACTECGAVAVTRVRLTVEELRRYRRDLMKTVQKVYQGYVKARSRLEEKCKVLAHRVKEGETEEALALRNVEARLKAVTQPDTSLLESRAKEVEGAIAAAPESAPPAPCEVCGAEMALYRESHRGYEIPCPRCTAGLVVRIGPM